MFDCQRVEHLWALLGLDGTGNYGFSKSSKDFLLGSHKEPQPSHGISWWCKFPFGNITIEHGPVEIVSFPIKKHNMMSHNYVGFLQIFIVSFPSKMVIFRSLHSYINVYQGVYH